MLSPMPGKVISVSVNAGDPVTQGQVLVIIEAMKMEHSVRSPAAGAVASVKVEPGDQVEADEVLIVVSEPGDAAEQPGRS